MTWDDEKMMQKYRCLVNSDLGAVNGVLIIDKSGFIKKRNDLAGVYRRYCGNIGKADNNQVGVFAAYDSSQGYALLDKRFFVPEPWFSPEYKEKRKKCRFPSNLEFKTKTQLAVDMIQEIVE